MRCSVRNGEWQCANDSTDGRTMCRKHFEAKRRANLDHYNKVPVPKDMLVGQPYEPRNLPKRPPGRP